MHTRDWCSVMNIERQEEKKLWTSERKKNLQKTKISRHNSNQWCIRSKTFVDTRCIRNTTYAKIVFEVKRAKLRSGNFGWNHSEKWNVQSYPEWVFSLQKYALRKRRVRQQKRAPPNDRQKHDCILYIMLCIAQGKERRAWIIA